MKKLIYDFFYGKVPIEQYVMNEAGLIMTEEEYNKTPESKMCIYELVFGKNWKSILNKVL